jgi:Zn2+/Cd2+-exporting ATPase
MSAPDHSHHGHGSEDCCPFHENLSEKQVHFRLILALYGGVILCAGATSSWMMASSVGSLLLLLACAIMAWPIFSDAGKALYRGRIGFPTLVALAFAACLSQGDLLAAGLVAFFMIMADQLENRSALGARLAVETLIRRTPDRVHLKNAQGFVDFPVAQLQVGQFIEIRPGEVLSVDGQVVEGESTLDESSITGESLPLNKKCGSDVYAGTTNLSGKLLVQVTRTGEDTTVGKVQKLILSASKAKTALSGMIEANASWYTRSIVMLAAITWFFFRDQSDALTRAIAILIMGCPCSLVLATPAVMIAAITAAARSGILVKRPQDLESIHRIRHMFFDKTGTLTFGEMALVRLECLSEVEKAEALSWAASLAKHSNHPHSRGLLKASEKAGVELHDVTHFEEKHGQGLRGHMGKEQIILGREEWVREILTQEHLPQEPQSRLILASLQRGFIASFEFEDKLRPEATTALEELRGLGIQNLSLITGDHASNAQKVATQLKFDHVHARCLPKDKLDRLEDSRKAGHLVAAVGDGINDAPVLAAAHVGIAMGAMGSPVAIESSSIALMGSDLSRLPILFRLSRKTDRLIKTNIAVSVAILFIGLLLSSLGIVSPIIAAVLHNLSSLFILFNSAQLVRQGESL